jgi:hypothetical protein
VIDLPPGGYTAEFRLPHQHPHIDSSEGQSEARSGAQVPLLVPTLQDSSSSKTYLNLRVHIGVLILIGASLVAALPGFYMFRGIEKKSALNDFWKPVLESPGSILVCVGRQHPMDLAPAPETGPTIRQYLRGNSIAWPDAITFSSIVALIRSQGHEYHLNKSDVTPFSEMRQSPAVLIGGFNNEWILKLEAPLRFRYATNASGHAWIEDQQNLSQQSWATEFNAPFSSFDQDYGIITRVKDTSTEQMTVIASGIAAYGTIAAGEFLTNEKYMKMVGDRAPKGWERKNMQVVFSTRVINGNSGPPRILATYFW